MTLRSHVRGWNEFFFKPQSPTPIALFRIFYGLLTIANLLMLRPEWLMWYGPRGFMTLETMHQMTTGRRVNFFDLLPQTDLAINVFFWGFLLVAICLTAGYMTRFSSVAVYMCLLSIHARNPFILNSGDTLMRVTGFFLMFAPAGAALSVDRLLRVRKGRETAAVPLYSPWAQRMIQIQTAVIYFATFYWKTLGTMWINGTAVYYAFHSIEFHRFPMPAIHNLPLLALLTWGTLAIEFSLGVLVWFRELRYPVLLAGLCLHLGIEYSMNIPLFEWISVAAYVTFIYPEDLSRAWVWIRNRMGHRLGEIRSYGMAWKRRGAA